MCINAHLLRAFTLSHAKLMRLSISIVSDGTYRCPTYLTVIQHWGITFKLTIKWLKLLENYNFACCQCLNTCLSPCILIASKKSKSLTWSFLQHFNAIINYTTEFFYDFANFANTSKWIVNTLAAIIMLKMELQRKPYVALKQRKHEFKKHIKLFMRFQGFCNI